MPTPVSHTSMIMRSLSRLIRTVTLPSEVNLNALLTRLRTINGTFPVSVTSSPSRSDGTSQRNATPGGRAKTAVQAWAEPALVAVLPVEARPAPTPSAVTVDPFEIVKTFEGLAKKQGAAAVFEP